MLIDRLTRWILLAAGVLPVAAALNVWVFMRPPVSAFWCAGSAAAALLFAIVGTWWRAPDIGTVARLLDQRGETRDRFATALQFAGSTRPWEDAAAQECAAFIRSFDVRPLLQLAVPRELRFLAIPLIATGLLGWHSSIGAARASVARAAAQEEIAGTVAQLEQLAKETDKASDQAQSDELKRIAQQLKRSAENLRAGADKSGEASRNALKELSALEQMIAEMRDASKQLTPDELQALAEALAEQEATKEAAAAMQAGRMADAAKELQEAGEKSGRDAEEAAQALKEALQRLAEKKQLSEQLEKLAKQLQQAGGKGQQALQRLAEMLRKMPAQKGQSTTQPSSGKKSQQTLESLLAALQNMKFGDGQPKNQAGTPLDGKGQPALAFQPGPEAGAPDGSLLIPGGKPGSERDTGTTDTPFGEQGSAAGNADAQQLAGRMGEGETLQQFLPSAGDASTSNRRYRELYDAMAPAAEDALVQENIPLGSRFFIKRYFESIRPSE